MKSKYLLEIEAPIPSDMDHAKKADMERDRAVYERLMAEEGPRSLTREERDAVRRVVARQQADEAKWTRDQWDAYADRVARERGYSAFFLLRNELERFPGSHRPNEIRFALLSLDTSDSALDADYDRTIGEDEVLPPTLIELLRFLVALGRGNGAPRGSVRLARIIEAAREEVVQLQ